MRFASRSHGLNYALQKLRESEKGWTTSFWRSYATNITKVAILHKGSTQPETYDEGGSNWGRNLYSTGNFKSDRKAYRREVERRLRIILLTKKTVVCATSHLTYKFAYDLLRVNPVLLDETMMIPALWRDKEPDYLLKIGFDFEKRGYHFVALRCFEVAEKVVKSEDLKRYETTIPKDLRWDQPI